MRTANDRLLGALFHGWVELLTLLLLLFVVLTLWGWANNRGYRPAERGPNTPWLLLLVCFALVALLRAVEASWPVAAMTGAALLLGGLLGRVVRETPLWLPAIALAVLLALGNVLSALVLAVTGFLLLVLNTRSA